MKKTLKYIGSFLFVATISVNVFSQKSAFIPSGIRLGTDVALLGASALNPNKYLLEINSDFDIYKFYFTADYGIGNWEFEKPEYRYSNSGSYIRLGLDYDFLYDDPDGNSIFVGLKYAFSNFEENFSYDIIDPYFGNYTKDIWGNKLNANWVEAVVGLKVRVWKGLYMGWIGRLKFAKSISSSNSSFNNFWIPGFGKGENDSAWGFGYQVTYQIQFWEKPIIKRKAKKEEEITPTD